MKNKLINLFALIGIITCVALACSVASDDDEPINPNPQTTNTTCEVEVDATLLNEYGKYQVAIINPFNSNGNGNIVVLNTKTGVMKSYYHNNNVFTETTVSTITFTH